MRLAVLLFALAFAAPAIAQDTTTTAAAPAPTAPAPLPAGPRVLIATTMGDIVLRLDKEHAPLTAANFLRYVKAKHFDGTCIYRVVPGFVIQAGSWDAEGKGRGVNDPIAQEATGLKNLRGAVAMTHGDAPKSTYADFFIELADQPSFDADPAKPGSGFTVFAVVEQGMDVVDRIATVPLGGKGPFAAAAPTTPIVIIKVSVLPDAKP
jgi:cyclophilin family peptidyl-prolyl cis-trans isomerase